MGQEVVGDEDVLLRPYGWGLLDPECLFEQLQKIITTQQPKKKIEIALESALLDAFSQ